MKIVEKSVNDIIPYENNPRFNDEAVEPVAESIRSFGFKIPIVIDKNNIIVAGHTRHKAALLLGLDKVPCIVADDLDENQIKAFRLVDNKVSEFSKWDFSKLEEELAQIDFDSYDFGFEEISAEKLSDFGDNVNEKEDSEFEEKKEQYTTCPSCGMHFVPILEME